MITSKNNTLKRAYTMRLGICDDNRADIENVEKVIETKLYNGLSNIKVKEYEPEELLVDIEEGLFDCEVLVIGICFKNRSFNGIDLVYKVNQFFPLCEVIFFSNYIEYALRVYDTKHCYYVLKTELEKMLPLAIDKAVTRLKDNTHNDILRVACNGSAAFIDKKKILYIERENRKVNIITDNKKYSCYLSLIKLMEKLGDYMLRVHGGYIANLAEIVHMDNDGKKADEDDLSPEYKLLYDGHSGQMAFDEDFIWERDDKKEGLGFSIDADYITDLNNRLDAAVEKSIDAVGMEYINECYHGQEYIYLGKDELTRPGTKFEDRFVDEIEYEDDETLQYLIEHEMIHFEVYSEDDADIWFANEYDYWY